MKQGTSEWHEHRARHFNASEAGAVMGCNPWAPKNPGELFDLKTGALVINETPAMRRGTELEPQARAAAEQIMDEAFTPTVMTRGRYSASLDGVSMCGTIALEVKCPGESSSLWGIKTPADLKAEKPNYWWQLVHQHYVAGFASVLFLVYSEERTNSVLIPSEALAADRDALLAAWERFGEALDNNERPETERTDSEWLDAAADYAEAKAAAAAAELVLDGVKKRLLALAGGQAAKGGGVSVIKSTRKGGVDEKAAKAAGINLDAYRKPDSIVFSVRG